MTSQDQRCCIAQAAVRNSSRWPAGATGSAGTWPDGQNCRRGKKRKTSRKYSHMLLEWLRARSQDSQVCEQQHGSGGLDTDKGMHAKRQGKHSPVQPTSGR